jgi:hypothetical protein
VTPVTLAYGSAQLTEVQSAGHYTRYFIFKSDSAGNTFEIFGSNTGTDSPLTGIVGVVYA